MFRHALYLFVASVALAGCASAPDHRHGNATGAVAAVYVEVAPDIYVSERLMATTPSRDYWVKVTIDDAQSTMARVPASLRLAAGDQVAMQLAEATPRDGERHGRAANRVLERLSQGALAVSEHTPRGDLIDRYLSDSAAATP